MFQCDHFLGFFFWTLFRFPHASLIIPFEPVPAILQEAIPATTQHIDSQLQVVQDQAYRYTAILEKVVKNPLLSQELQPYMLKEALYNLRQYEIFLQIILVSLMSQRLVFSIEWDFFICCKSQTKARTWSLTKKATLITTQLTLHL